MPGQGVMDDVADNMVAALAQIRQDIVRAQHTADGALARVNTHEEVCGLRYETITTKLADLPRIYDKIDAMGKSVTAKTDEMASRLNIATGVWIGVGGVALIVGIIYTLMQMTGKAK